MSRALLDINVLLALACANEGRFVTFDRSVPTSAVVGASEHHLAVI